VEQLTRDGDAAFNRPVQADDAESFDRDGQGEVTRRRAPRVQGALLSRTGEMEESTPRGTWRRFCEAHGGERRRGVTGRPPSHRFTTADGDGETTRIGGWRGSSRGSPLEPEPQRWREQGREQRRHTSSERWPQPHGAARQSTERAERRRGTANSERAAGGAQRP
jgi:hypothetical protein